MLFSRAVVCLFDSWMAFAEGLALNVVIALDFLLPLDLGPLSCFVALQRFYLFPPNAFKPI